MSGYIALVALFVGAMPQEEAVRARELEQRAHDLQVAGQFHDAEKPLQEAIELWTRYEGPENIEVLNDEMNLGVAYRRGGEAARGISLLEHAAEGLKKSSDPDAPQLHRQALNNLAVSYQFAGRLDEARAALEKCLAEFEQGGPDPERAQVLDNLASVVLDGPKPDLAEALRYARRALEEWKSVRGEENVDVAISTSTVGTILMRQGDLEAARPLLERALALTKKLLGEDHPEVGASFYLVGELEERSGNRSAARRNYEAALAIGRKHFDDQHPRVQDALQGLAALDRERPANKAQPLVIIAVAVLSLVGLVRRTAGRLAPRVAIAPLVFLVTRWPVLVAWAVGATGFAALLLPSAIERGHDSVSDLAVLGGLSVLCGLGVAAGVVGPGFCLVRAFHAAPTFELQPGEVVVREVAANHFLKGEARGGKLLMTDRRLGFRPHRFNVQLATWSVGYDQIESVQHEGERFLIIRHQGSSSPEWLVVANAADLERRVAGMVDAARGPGAESPRTSAA